MVPSVRSQGRQSSVGAECSFFGMLGGRRGDNKWELPSEDQAITCIDCEVKF